MKNRLLLFIFLAFFWACVGAGESFAAVPIPKGIGVCIQFGIPDQELDMVKSAGFTIARTDLKWGIVERTRGQYDWTSADNLVNRLTSRGIRPYLILDYNNFAYGASQELAGITTQDQINGYTNFAKAAAARYKGKGIIWEIWNEPNLDVFWRPVPNSTQYMNLVKSAVPAMKAADPNAIIVAPAVAYIANTLQFLDECGAQGLFGLVDAVSVHPYKDAAPETGAVDNLYNQLRTIIARRNPGNPNLPIIGGEFGFSVTWSSVQNETKQSQYLTRQLLYHDYKNIPISMIYDFKNDGTNPADSEANFGIIRNDRSIKPAYNDIKTLIQNVGGMNFSKRLPSASTDYIFEYNNPSTGAQTAAAWTTGAAHTISIYGQSVNLTNSPIYVKNGSATPTPTVPVAASNLQVTNITKGATSGNYFVNLTWVDNSNNETGFQIQQSVGSENSYQTIAAPASNNTGFSVDIGTSPTQGTYYYKILAINAVGASQASNVVSANVQTAPAPTAPASPSNLQVTNVTKGATSGAYFVNLTWVDNSNNETGFQIQQSVGSTNTFQTIATPAQDNIGFSVNLGTAPASGTYYYRILSINAVGASQPSTVVNANVQVTQAALVPIPKGHGTCISISASAQDLDMVKDAGFTIARTDMKWGAVERVKGQYDWTNYDQLVNNLTSRGITPYFILDYNNANYGAGNELAGISTSAQIQGYTNFANAAAAHYKGKGIIWELWNEPNLDQFWTPANNASQYMALVKAAVPAIKAADPNAIVVAPAVAFVANTFSFLDTCGQQGLFGLVDAVSLHPYKDAAPETGSIDYLVDTVRTMIAKYNPNNPNLPIIGGEFGFSVPWSSVKNETTQAQYLTRQLLYHDYKKIPISMIYDFKNDGTNAADPEANFGIIRADSSLKPAYTAIKTLNQTLAGMNFSGRLPSASTDYIYEYTNSSGVKTAAAWTTGAAHAVTIYSQSVNLTNMPVYVKNVAVPPPAPSVSPSNLSVQVGVIPTTGMYNAILNWTDNATSETGYDIYQSLLDVNNFKLVSSINAVSATGSTNNMYSIGVNPAFGTYYYKVVAKFADGTTQASNIANAEVKEYIPLTPTNLTGVGTTDTTNKTVVVLTWKNNSSNVSGFNIYFASSQGGSFTKVGTANKTATMIVHPVTAAGTYYYQINSYNCAGESSSSTVIPVVVN